MKEEFEKLAIIGGGSHPALMEEVVGLFGIDHIHYRLHDYANVDFQPQLTESVEGKDVYVFQTFSSSPKKDRYINELLQLIRTCQEHGASKITAVLPYYSYARSHKDKPDGVPITGQLLLEFLRAAGAERVIVFTLHHPSQTEKFFSKAGLKLVNLNPDGLFLEALKELDKEQTVVLTADEGHRREAQDFAAKLGVDCIEISKSRSAPDKVRVDDIQGRGKPIVIFKDDELSTVTTAKEDCQAACQVFPEIREIILAATHPVLCGRAIENLTAIPRLKKVLVTNTVPVASTKRIERMEIFSVAALLKAEIQRTYKEFIQQPI